MRFSRRGFVQAGVALLGSAATGRFVAAQDRPRNSVHPPDPSGHEFDIVTLRDRHASGLQPETNARQRENEFRSCLAQLLTSAMKLRDQINGVPLSGILSVQLYRDTQAMERLVKRLKSLART